MKIKPIRTQADYEIALKEIDRLFQAKPDTPEGKRLEMLAALVEAYEDQHYDIPLPDPVDVIIYYMESRGLSYRDLEPYMGNYDQVREVLNRQRPLHGR